MSRVLLVDGVSRTYPSRAGEVVALREVSFALDAGTSCALVGASGCGKSTALAIIAGLDEPSSGRIYVSGREVSAPGADRGLVFQRDALFPWLSVRDNARFSLTLGAARTRPPVGGDEVDALLRRVGLWAFRDHLPHQLSGGMRQRVALVRALATRPPLLLMDEPFAALDAQNREQMQELVDAICVEHGITLLIVTHDLEEAAFLADRILVMQPRPGRIVAEQTVDVPRPRRSEHRLSPVLQDLRGRLGRLLHHHPKEIP